MEEESLAYCTLLTNDAYLVGGCPRCHPLDPVNTSEAALVLAKSLRDTGTTIPICAMVVAEAMTADSRHKLTLLYDKLIEVPAIAGLSSRNLEIIGRPDLHDTLTKLNLWALTEHKRILYLDADTLVLANLDHLFSLPYDIEFAASPELGFPDCFNSGVMLLRPSNSVFSQLNRLAAEVESFDGGDQGLLNIYFGDGTYGHPQMHLLPVGSVTTDQTKLEQSIKRSWYRLSFTYNMEMHKVYRFYIPAVLRYKPQHKILHFIGKDKPWHFPDGKIEKPEDAPAYFEFYSEMIEKWWAIRRGLPCSGF